MRPTAALRLPKPVPDKPPEALPVFVLTRAGLDPAAYRGRPLNRRIAACLRALNVDTPESACALLMERPELLADALDALLIGVTTFFRDNCVFRMLETVVIPELQRRGGRLRIWSAGSSTGAELYSLAMLLAEAGLLERSLLLGTDRRIEAVLGGRAAVFPASSLRDIRPALRARYCERVPGAWRPVEALRRRTRWAASDLTRAVPHGPWDLVLCRNLVIYLQPSAAESLFVRIAGAMAESGFLVTGTAERPPSHLGLQLVGSCVYRM